jgi:hypothetical protein
VTNGASKRKICIQSSTLTNAGKALTFHSAFGKCNMLIYWNFPVREIPLILLARHEGTLIKEYYRNFAIKK